MMLGTTRAKKYVYNETKQLNNRNTYIIYEFEKIYLYNPKKNGAVRFALQ